MTTIDRQSFFAECRASFGSLTQENVDGLNAILDACEGIPVDHIAYVMATAYHETGGKIYPNRESTYYSTAGRILSVFGKSRLQGNSAASLAKNSQLLANVVYGGEWGEKNLGNKEWGDGWKYRGGGMDHTTGLSNYRKAAAVTGVDLVSHPELITRVDVAAKVIAAGMSTGWYRGKKLSDYGTCDFYNMRDIINADKSRNGSLVAGYADKFYAALTGAVVAPSATTARNHWIIDAIVKLIAGWKK